MGICRCEIASRIASGAAKAARKGPMSGMRAGEDAWEFDEPPRSSTGCLQIRYLSRSSEVRFFGSRFLDCAFAVLAVFGLSSASAARRVGQLRLQARPDRRGARRLRRRLRQLPEGLRQGSQGSALPHALYRVRVTASAVHVTKGRKLLEAGDEQGALTEFLHAAEIDPSNEAAQQEIAKVRRSTAKCARRPRPAFPRRRARGTLDSMGAPAELKPSPTSRSRCT
jgi:hypothetical protein